MNRRTYYQLLHVQPDAPLELIKASYRTLMLKLKYHPDLGGSEWNAALINEAFAVLSNAEQRVIYDREHGDVEKSVGPTAWAIAKPTLTPATPEPTPPVPSASLEPIDSRICAFCEIENSRNYQSAEEVCRVCGGPLRFLDFADGDSIERGARRIEYQSDIHYRVDSSRPGSTRGRVMDLSPTGLRFFSPQWLTQGCVIKIDSPTLSAIARVTRSTAENTTGLFSTGVRFLTLKLSRPQGTFLSESA